MLIESLGQSTVETAFLTVTARETVRCRSPQLGMRPRLLFKDQHHTCRSCCLLGLIADFDPRPLLRSTQQPM